MRYIPHTEEDISSMLEAAGLRCVEDLFRSIPQKARLTRKLNLPGPLSEQELVRVITEIGKKNSPAGRMLSLLGAGSYRHFIPAAVGEIANRSEWVTPYTPYQPEINQGTLQAIFEYQTMVCNLTGMEVANASHYDGATSTAEAAQMAINKTHRKSIAVASTIHPEYRDTIRTVLKPLNRKIIEIPFDRNGCIDQGAMRGALNSDVACVIIQSPNFFGIIEDLEEISKIVHSVGAMFIVTITEPISLGILEGPGRFGADIVTAEGQAFGSGMNFGGPCLGIFATLQKYARAMPGRISGMTADTEGRRGFVLTLSTREQHIRREKATSNICSNEALLATTAAIYLSLLGKVGLKKVAEINLANAEYLKSELSNIDGVTIAFDSPTFNEFVVRFEKDAKKIHSALAKKGIYAGVPLERWYPELKNCVLICTTECHTKEDLDRFVEELL